MRFLRITVSVVVFGLVLLISAPLAWQDTPKDPSTAVHNWLQLANEYLAERDTLWPIVLPFSELCPLKDAPDAATLAAWQARPEWYVAVDDGERLYEDSGALAKFVQAGDRVWLYEEAVAGEIRVMLEASDRRFEPVEVAAYSAPASEATDLVQLEQDLAHRRVLWYVTMQPKSILAERALSGGSGGFVIMSGEGESYPTATGITFHAIAPVSNGIRLVMGYASGYTNGLDVFASTDLVAEAWTLAATNLCTTGSEWIAWTDTATNSLRFYAAGDAVTDADGDGLQSAREFFLYHTDPGDVDSDGDGLVDGFSGVVSTNSYSGGVVTGGSAYVEGEITHGTSALLGDTDDDGVSDGTEVHDGTDPTDGDFPPNVWGTVSYAGWQTGAVYVVAVTNESAWSTNKSCCLTNPSAYRISALLLTNYHVKAFRDTDGDAAADDTEAQGIVLANPVVITNRLTGQDIDLLDPDTDEDGLPDWWEMCYWTNLTSQTATNDPDGDLYANEDEYLAHTDPTASGSHPLNIAGTIAYTGEQPGEIRVIATATSSSWDAVGTTLLSTTGAYTLTHLPVDEMYWIKAWVDGDGDGNPEFGEAWGAYASGVLLDEERTNVNITLADADSDGDGLPDWWEIEYGLDPTNGGVAAASAQWDMDGQGSETNVADSGASGLDGALFGGGSQPWTEGAISNALTLDGVDAYVQLPDDAELKPEYVTVALWIRPALADTNAAAVLFSKRTSGSATGYELVYTNGQLRFTICSSGAKTVSYAGVLTNGQWTHVAGAYSGSRHALFLDGVEVAATNYDWGTGFGYLDHSTDGPRIGAALGTTPAGFFAGEVDRVLMFASGLSEAQVAALAEIGRDHDLDGRTTAQEYQTRTDPMNSDTDGDGLSDGEEKVLGTDAKVKNPVVTLGPETVVEYRSAIASRQKVGYADFVPATNGKPVFFLSALIEEGGENYIPYLEGLGTNYQFQYSYTHQEEVNPTNGVAEQLGTWSSSLECEYDGEPGGYALEDVWTNEYSLLWGTPQEDVSIAAHGHTGTRQWIGVETTSWANAASPLPDFSHDVGLDTLWNTTNAQSGLRTMDGVFADAGGNPIAGSSCAKEETRSTPYTTNLLFALTQADLDSVSLSNLDWGVGVAWTDNSASTGTALTVSRRELPTNEVSLYLARTGYRFVVPTTNTAPPTVYRLAWLEIYSGTNGTWTGMVAQASHSTNFVGNGQTNYVGGALEPPGSNGVVLVSVVKVEFLDSASIPVAQIKVAKWENAFSGSTPTFDDEFIDEDSARFYIRITDLSKAGHGEVSVDLSTDAADAAWDDAATEIRLEETTSGIFESDALLLVSNEIDDRERHNGNDGAISGGGDNNQNDRTHMVRLGSQAKAEYSPAPGVACGSSVTVPSVGTVTIEIEVLEDEYGNPVAETSNIVSHIRVLKETFAQVGVTVRAYVHFVTTPAGVDLSDGITVFDVNGTNANVVTAEAKSLIRQCGTHENTNDIHVFYVKGLRHIPIQSCRGTQLRPGNVAPPDMGYANNILIDAEGAHPFTLAHELPHVLMDSGTHRDGLGEEPNEPWNLMHPTSPTNDDISNTKRLDSSQEQSIQGASHVH